MQDRKGPRGGCGVVQRRKLTSLRMKGHKYRSALGLPGTLGLLEARFRIASPVDGAIPDLYDIVQLIHLRPCVSP